MAVYDGTSDNEFNASGIRSVAVIGAGPSGLPAARHLKESGLDVVVFEQADTAGGIWRYTSDESHEEWPRTEQFVVDNAKAQTTKLRHSPPTPTYERLQNNVPLPTMGFQDYPWTQDGPWYANQSVIGDFVRSYARRFNLEELVQYNTRVERVKEVTQGELRKGWEVITKTLTTVVREDGWQEAAFTWNRHHFDAVVVASGHYAEPHIPAFEGLREWATAYPESIWHAKDYRHPSQFASAQSVLVIGANASGIDIARELGGSVPALIHVIRDFAPEVPQQERDVREAFRAGLPASNIRKNGVTRFIVADEHGRPGIVEFLDGSVLEVDTVIFATGYHFSYPFLSHLERPGDTSSPSPENVIVTRGDATLNLHRDIFYIPNPSLAFLGVPLNTATFSFHEYSAIAIARVFAGYAELPSRAEMRDIYLKRIAVTGEGRRMHTLGGPGEIAVVAELVAWLNGEAKRLGKEQEVREVVGHSKEWLEVTRNRIEGIKARDGLPSRVVLDAEARLIREASSLL
ncbi:FAD/NAD(P)-binding domain-containing protein [Punctularia strigosozonata HHB-11173 SS5]|uniref:FAD/NAD(P)-binding domain-containing protein n=1 Tax=Punctularia strigosozonata (strain HHB-11173) TaxID=741275 RepID=UPI0004416E7A|nr:FAD/NAD(P)-binding domain-containing protein [Punctularia strigosozonata HHB-11173 SS5]EIN08775.1 FAD/NAD(P)-binding domain-containing protein [Punctularia strigosozonata HHB-11173 SS5]